MRPTEGTTPNAESHPHPLPLRSERAKRACLVRGLVRSYFTTHMKVTMVVSLPSCCTWGENKPSGPMLGKNGLGGGAPAILGNGEKTSAVWCDCVGRHHPLR